MGSTPMTRSRTQSGVGGICPAPRDVAEPKKAIDADDHATSALMGSHQPLIRDHIRRMLLRLRTHKNGTSGGN